METVRKFLDKDDFAKHCGIELLEVSPGRAIARMCVGPQHLNGVRVCHGGAIFSLADFAFAAASNSHGTIAVAINASISYLKAAREGLLTAEAEEVAVSPKLASYRIDVTDEAGDIVAIFQGMVYRKKDKTEP